jgi:tRNA(Ile)-lysidine synthase
LLHALAALRPAYGFRLTAIHVDHGLHPESGFWAHHCTAVCENLGIPVVVEVVRVERATGKGLEAAARHARYAALARHLGPDETLLTAHHQDDQAETVLLHLARGTGMQGLAAMPEKTRFQGAWQVRPLLNFSRAELRSYALAENLRWIDDPSNTDTHYRRNLLRLTVLPQLAQTWPQVTAALARTARHARDCADLLDDVARQDVRACQDRALPGVLSIGALVQLTPARQRNLVRYWLRTLGHAAPSAQHLDDLLAGLAQPTRSGHGRYTWPGTEIRRYRDQLHAMRPLATSTRGYDLAWDLTTPLALPDDIGCLRWKETVGQGLARARLLHGPVRVRARSGGEVCRRAGRPFHQRLKKMLQECGVAPWWRERLPLIYVGDALVAVADLWVCEPYAATAGEEALRIVWERAPEAPATD